MKSKIPFAAAVALLASLAVPAAHAATIDFEDLSSGTVLASPFTIGDAGFSSPDSLMIADIGTGNAICGASNGACISAIGMTFETGASLLQFTFSGDTDPTTQYILDINATVVIEGEAVPLHMTAIAFANGNPLDGQLVQFENPNVTIMSFGMYSLDDTAFVLDNISYTPGITSPIPEPASWGMLMAGLGLTGMALRRRSARGIAG